MTDRIRYESKKAFAKAKDGDDALPIGLKAWAAAMGRWAAQRTISQQLAEHKNAREDNGQPKDFEP